MSSDWANSRKTARVRMLRYQSWKRHTVDQIQWRMLSNMRKRIGRGYTAVFTPTFKIGRAA